MPTITKIKISGKLLCDYIWYVNRPLNKKETDDVKNPEYEPSWTVDTGFLTTFNNSLLAGNISDGDAAPTAWRVYRQESGSERMDFAALIDTKRTSVTDYNIKNGKEYTYHVYTDTNMYIHGGMTSKPIKTEWLKWCLFSADEAGLNKYKFHEGFLFEFNITPSQMGNNLVSAKHANFTRYPKIIKGTSNYYSGTLSALLGYIDCDKNKYTDNAAMLDALSDFTTDARAKFLKDIYGHIWRVEITEPLSATPNHYIGGVSTYAVSVGWTQTDNTENIIIND